MGDLASMQHRASVCLTIGNDDLFDATKKNEEELVLDLLSQSCSPNQFDLNQWTPLHFTCAYNNLAIAKILIDHKADICALDKGKRTPLHFSCRSSSLPLIELLVNNHADVNAIDMYTRTPLHCLFSNAGTDKLESVKLLLHHGADLHLKDNNGETPIHLAAKIGDTVSVKVLLAARKDLIQVRDQQKQTPLHKATFFGHYETIKIILEANGNVSQTDKSGRSPLHYTCYHKNKDIVRLLLEHNGDLRALDNQKKSPIQLVAEKGNLSLLAYLLSKTNKSGYDGICYDTIRPATGAWLIRQNVPGPRTKTLNLKGTQLDWLPTADSFWQSFQDLTDIHLEDNLLQSIPTAVLLVPSLEEIFFADNPLLDFPDFTKKDWPTLRKHLQTLRRNAIEWQERKIILVGPSAGGKTSVQQVLSKGRRIRCGDYIPTQELQIEYGVSFSPLYKKLLMMDRNPFVFSIWDLCGNREMFPLHQCFLTSNSIYLLVFDITKWREQLHSIDEWVQQIVVSGCNGTRTPIVFVATHRDCIPSKIVECEQMALHRNIHKRYPINRYRGVFDEIFLLSCKTREGFVELQEVLERLAGIIQPVGSAQWMRVHEHILFKKNKKKVNLLPLESYIRIAEVHGVTDRTQRKKMTHFLRCIGTLDYFVDHDSDLRDIVILDSAWLSREISRWIQEGKFEGKDEKLLSQVLHIAEQLGVLHILQDGTAMIPNTLPASKPSHLLFWRDCTLSNNLFEHGRRYTFGYIPDGLFSRIIARILSIERAEMLAVWRYGVAIRYKNQLAMITHTPVVAGHVVHELTIRCQFSETVLFKNSLDESDMLNPHELLLYRLIILIHNFVHCYFPHLLQLATQWIPCFHCLKEKHKPTHYFHLNEVLRAEKRGTCFVYCKYPHGSSSTSKPLWAPLLIPDHVTYQSDQYWQQSKIWTKGEPITLCPTKQLRPLPRKAHYHEYTNISHVLYNETNEFVVLSGDTAHRKNACVRSITALSASVVWIGYDTGSIGIYQISEQEDQSVFLSRVTRWRAHNGAVTALVPVSVSLEPLDVCVWSSGEDGVIRVWDAQTTLQQRSFSHRNEVIKLLVTNNYTPQVRIWSICADDAFVTICRPSDQSCECLPLWGEDEDSTSPSPSKLMDMEVHGDYVLIGKGAWIFIVSVSTTNLVAVWQAESQEVVSGLHSVIDTNILLSWTMQSSVIHVWYLFPDADEEILEVSELVGHSASIASCCSIKLNNQTYIWTSSTNGEVIIWDASKLEKLFYFQLVHFDSYKGVMAHCFGNHLLTLEKQIMITTNVDLSIGCCRSLFYKPTPYFRHRVSINYAKLATCLSDYQGHLFAKYIAPGDEMLQELEAVPYFEAAIVPLIETIIYVAENAVLSPLSTLLSKAEHCTKYIRALAALISEDGMLAGDLVLPIYIYGVVCAMDEKKDEFPVYHHLIYLQYRFKSFGDDNDACQLTHIIAAAIVTPRLFDIILHPSQI